MRAGKQSSGIQFAPRTQMGSPSMVSSKRDPTWSARVSSAMVRKPTRRSQVSSNEPPSQSSTLSGYRGCEPRECGHHRSTSGTSSRSATRRWSACTLASAMVSPMRPRMRSGRAGVAHPFQVDLSARPGPRRRSRSPGGPPTPAGRRSWRRWRPAARWPPPAAVVPSPSRSCRPCSGSCCRARPWPQHAGTARAPRRWPRPRSQVPGSAPRACVRRR